jgi:hypothetical protein
MTMTTYTKEDVTAIEWARSIINSRGAIELTPSRIDRLTRLAGRASAGAPITSGDKELLEWVAYEIREHPVGGQLWARWFDALLEKLDIDYRVANYEFVTPPPLG